MTSPISATGTGAVAAAVPQSTAVTNTAADNTKLSSKAFLQLLVAQLKYQDPSKPVDTASFMNETATLTQVQTMETNSQNSTDMLTAQRAQTAGSLVGKTVTYSDAKGAVHTGVVSSATISTANPTLSVNGVQIDLSSIQQVLASTAATPPGTP